MHKRIGCVLLAAFLCVPGCFALAAQDAALYEGIGLFMECFVALEEMLIAQLDVIHACQAFLDAPDEKQREALSQAEEAAHARLSLIALPSAEMEPDVYAALLAHDIDPSFYDALVTGISYQLGTLHESIAMKASISSNLYDAGEPGAAREYLQYTLAYLQSEMRGTCYDINAIFVGQDGEVLEHIRRIAARSVPVLFGLGLPWENDLMAIMEKQTLELDLMTEQLDALEALINEHAWLLILDENRLETYAAVAALLERRAAENSSFVDAIEAARFFAQGTQTQAEARGAVRRAMLALSGENEESASLLSAGTFQDMEQERGVLAFHLELLMHLLGKESVDAQAVQDLIDILEQYHAARTVTEIALVHEFALLEAADEILFRQVVTGAFASFAQSDAPWSEEIETILAGHIAALEAMRQALEDLGNLIDKVWGV